MKENYRELFEYDSEIIYMNNAATGMQPTPSTSAMIEFIKKVSREGKPPIEEILALQAGFREEAGKLLHVNPNQCAFIKNTSDGLSIALHSIDWQPGDNMVVQKDAFPASLYLANYCFPNVEKRYVSLLGGGDFYDALQRTIDGSTRAVVVDYVHFLSGTRLNLNRLWEKTRETNSYLIIDGIQALGAVKIDLQETPVDFFCAGGVKWLLSPAGTGILYVRQEIMNELIPFRIGWGSAEYSDISSLYPVRPLYGDARRFQPINENYIGMIALTESMKMFNKIGSGVVENRIMELTGNMMSGLKALGCQLMTPEAVKNRAGIVTFKHQQLDSIILHEKLVQSNVACSLREGWVRFSIHFYSSVDEVNKVLNILKTIIKA